jgi:hypothetical protein
LAENSSIGQSDLAPNPSGVNDASTSLVGPDGLRHLSDRRRSVIALPRDSSPSFLMSGALIFPADQSWDLDNCQDGVSSDLVTETQSQRPAIHNSDNTSSYMPSPPLGSPLRPRRSIFNAPIRESPAPLSRNDGTVRSDHMSRRRSVITGQSSGNRRSVIPGNVVRVHQEAGLPGVVFDFGEHNGMFYRRIFKEAHEMEEYLQQRNGWVGMAVEGGVPKTVRHGHIIKHLIHSMSSGEPSFVMVKSTYTEQFRRNQAKLKRSMEGNDRMLSEKRARSKANKG